MVGGFIISRFWKALGRVTIPGHSIFSYHEEAKVLFSSGLSCSNVPSLEDEEKKFLNIPRFLIMQTQCYSKKNASIERICKSD